MVQPSQPDSAQDTRRRLLESAIVVFAHKGFDGAGIREIAQKAQANSALVQYYFGGKEGLYRAALQYLFDQGPDAVGALEPPPTVGEPEAFPRAIASLKGYIRAFLEDLFACHGEGMGSPEMHAAAHLFWTRELLDPTGERAELILQHIQPHVDYMQATMAVLRPDLDEESRFLMGCSVHSQIMFFHRDMAMVAMLRGKPYGPQDLDALAHHITEFSLRGLGLGDALEGA